MCRNIVENPFNDFDRNERDKIIKVSALLAYRYGKLINKSRG